MTTNNTQKSEIAVFGNGCFWCSEAIFANLEGAIAVEPGYSGGDLKNPSYDDVCSGETGHAEVIKITFDPDILSYKKLLEVFFLTHDPTSLNKQGADVGTQYRSVIFYNNTIQKEQAIEAIELLNHEKIWEKQIVTEVSPLETYYSAEQYHHNYFENNQNQGYCQFVIRPKVEKFKKVFAEYLKEK